MVRFNPKARLDQSRVRDAGSGGGGGGFGGGGGGMRLPIPTGRGGIGTVVVLVILYVAAKALGIDYLRKMAPQLDELSCERAQQAEK